MLKMVDGTGIIGVDMICPLGVSTPQPPNYDRVELEGAGMLALPNSLDAPLERLELGGKTAGKKEVIQAGELEQGTITAHAGTNYDSNYRVRTKNYINLTSGTYEVTCTGAKQGNAVFYSVENKFEKMLSGTHIPLPIKFTLTENKLVRVLFSNSESTPIAPTDIKNAILEADVSPEHQQDIVNSGKWNEETQKYEVDVKVTGKNLLNLQKEPDVKGTYQGWKVGNGESLTLGVKNKGNNADIKGCYIGFSNQGIEPKGVVWVVDNGVIKANPLIQRKAYVSIFPANETTVKKLTDRFDIQCELGNVATPYQPYKEQTLTLTSDRPITKWDRLVEQGGQIGWLYQSEIDDNVKPSRTDLFPYGFSLYKNQENGTYTYRTTNIKKAIGFQTSYCKQFLNKDAAYQTAELWHYSDQPSMQTQYFNTDITTAEEFIEWMESNPLTMVFKTESATFAPLPQSEQNAIRALKTYYPTTVITADGGELDPDIKVTYRKEI